MPFSLRFFILGRKTKMYGPLNSSGNENLFLSQSVIRVRTTFPLIPLIKTSSFYCQVYTDFQSWQNKRRKITQPTALLTWILYLSFACVSLALCKSGTNCNDIALFFFPSKSSSSLPLYLRLLFNSKDSLVTRPFVN